MNSSDEIAQRIREQTLKNQVDVLRGKIEALRGQCQVVAERAAVEVDALRAKMEVLIQFIHTTDAAPTDEVRDIIADHEEARVVRCTHTEQSPDAAQTELHAMKIAPDLRKFNG